MFITKDMRVAHNHLVANAIEHVGNIKGALLLPYLGIKDKMEHKVAKFLLHLVEVVVEDGLAKFVCLLDGEMAQAVVSNKRLKACSLSSIVGSFEGANVRNFVFLQAQWNDKNAIFFSCCLPYY